MKFVYQFLKQYKISQQHNRKKFFIKKTRQTIQLSILFCYHNLLLNYLIINYKLICFLKNNKIFIIFNKKTSKSMKKYFKFSHKLRLNINNLYLISNTNQLILVCTNNHVKGRIIGKVIDFCV